jgi:signal transduction histidine kinase
VTPRRRILVLCVIALFTGLVAAWLADQIVRAGFALTGGCRSFGSWTLCQRLGSHPVMVRDVVLVVGIPLLAWAFARAARWPLSALPAVTEAIGQAGPQNLGYRIRPQGGDDEVHRLSLAIDAMMDRIAAGYEGQRRFAANASHELRTPLAVQRTLIEVGLAQPLSAEQIQLLTRQLLQTNERNEQLIEGLLVLSESDQGLVSRTPQRLDEIAAEVAAAHQDRAERAGVELVVRLQPRTVPGERVLLERLVVNLVQNAIKYNRPGGSVGIGVTGEPALSVVNTGPVIPPEAVARLFEPFRRLSSDRMDHSGGSGLGLTIARSIAQAHDGTISATAQQPDGLRVDVFLPGAG